MRWDLLVRKIGSECQQPRSLGGLLKMLEILLCVRSRTDLRF
jgi:hypothetical protein